MDVVDVAKVLYEPNTTQSVYLKAIKLFEFQVSIFAPNSEMLQTDARILVAIRILEHIQKSYPHVSDGATLTELLSLPGYGEIADIIFQSGGWRKIRQLWSGREFDEHLSIRRKEAKIVAELADFSYRFAKSMSNDSRKGGSTMARACLRKVNNQKEGYSASTLKSRWSEYGSAAALQYILLIQKIGPKLLKLSEVKFVEQLVSQTSESTASGVSSQLIVTFRRCCDLAATTVHGSRSIALTTLSRNCRSRVFRGNARGNSGI
jgi:hypothetical protein